MISNGILVESSTTHVQAKKGLYESKHLGPTWDSLWSFVLIRHWSQN